jgi:hypothetical protein
VAQRGEWKTGDRGLSSRQDFTAGNDEIDHRGKWDSSIGVAGLNWIEKDSHGHGTSLSFEDGDVHPRLIQLRVACPERVRKPESPRKLKFAPRSGSSA